ncbi:YibE/F family protein [Clostridium pasteurianum]|uniref:Putative multitransmembrane protein n=1 Tax=Clostridium pasteurianum BC1 TaxID=86416 RepID=R4KBX0_CLOPA|nr:YibE/F family protein [Clostridium pasteurianum]AGK98004.1 putative multitransmembrane protein [Clostridium pasteurianum BC1]
MNRELNNLIEFYKVLATVKAVFKNKKNIIIGIILILIAVCFFSYKNFVANEDDNQPVHGVVISENSNTSSSQQTQKNSKSMESSKVQVKITSGSHKGTVLSLDNLVNDKTFDETLAHKGSEVLVNIDENDNGSIKSAYIYEVVRYKYIYILLFVFVGLLAIIGGKKGIKSIAALLLTGVVILKILIPLIISGFNPIVVSIILCISVSILNLLIISGKNKKTLAAIIGTVGGVIIAAIIGISMSTILRLTGLTDDELQMLIYISQNTSFDFRGLLFSGILMGALGAVMDVSMSIASAVNEIKENNKEISTKELIKSGMNVGRDIMGTMANTLILAYVGGSMYILMLVSSYNLPMSRILDQDVIASEVLKSLAGSIGLIFTIPITAAASAWLFI